MKDLPHHMKKLNRRIIRSSLHEQTTAMDQELELPHFHESAKEERKMAKLKMKNEARSKTPIHDSVSEKNLKMKHRTPIFDRNNAKPKVAKATKKKTPKI